MANNTSVNVFWQKHRWISFLFWELLLTHSIIWQNLHVFRQRNHESLINIFLHYSSLWNHILNNVESPKSFEQKRKGIDIHVRRRRSRKERNGEPLFVKKNMAECSSVKRFRQRRTSEGERYSFPSRLWFHIHLFNTRRVHSIHLLRVLLFF